MQCLAAVDLPLNVRSRQLNCIRFSQPFCGRNWIKLKPSLTDRALHKGSLASCGNKESGEFFPAAECVNWSYEAIERSSGDGKESGRINHGFVLFAAALLFSSVTAAVLVDAASAAVATQEEKSVSAVVKAPLEKSGKIAQEQPSKRAKKGAKLMTFEERSQYLRDMPTVEEKIPYTDLLGLKSEGNIKAIVKHPKALLMSRPTVCLVVRNDDVVLRTVLPAMERDTRFWVAWKTEGFSSLVIDAFTPSLQLPSPEPWGQQGPSLVWLAEWLQKLIAQLKTFVTRLSLPSAPKKVAGKKAKMQAEQTKERRKLTVREKEELAMEKKKRELELQRRKLEVESRERERELKEQREERALFEIQRKKERAERLREEETKLQMLEKEEIQKITKVDEEEVQREKLRAAEEARAQRSLYYGELARNDVVQFVLGVGFIFIFYNTVVVNIKKRKKDYDDRIKLKQAEDEEREEEERAQRELVNAQMWDGREDLTEEERRQLAEEEASNPLFAMSRQFLKSGAKVQKGALSPKGKSLYAATGETVLFDDVAGIGPIRRELEEVVEFFLNAQKYLRRGTKIPTGVLLCGPPGVGKTLLARAVAGEAGVSFFSISASQFVEVYVGVGAARVRALYNEAKQSAPSVVFIDELDAVGRQRGVTEGSGGQERDATLNQLLLCLDGFEGGGEVVTIAATNRVDVLDAALVRPGRFDRKIFVPLPDHRGRMDILKVHARKKPMAPWVDYEAVGNVTERMSGAQLANILDVAALRVLRAGGTQIETEDLLDAVLVEEGIVIRQPTRTPAITRQVAFHEAVQATVAGAMPRFQDVLSMSIVQGKGMYHGTTKYSADYGVIALQCLSRQDYLDLVTVQIASRVADEMWHGKDQMTTVWASAANKARNVARWLVLQGLTDRTKYSAMYEVFQPFHKVQAVDAEARKLLEACTDRARNILERNRRLVDVFCERLLEEQTLEGSVVKELREKYADYDPVRPSLESQLELRLAEVKAKVQPGGGVGAGQEVAVAAGGDD